MPRRRIIGKRAILPDHRYESIELTRLIRQMMTCGKLSIAEKIAYGALSLVETRLKRSPLAIFQKALEHIRPVVEVKTRRVGGASYQVPIEVRSDRATALAIRWLVEFARKRGEQGMMQKLAGEIMDAADEEGGSKGKGGAVKKREDTHRMAEANKAFSHFRF